LTQRVRIKMCGMTRVDDIHYAASLGVDAIGLIFYPQSPRYVAIEHAKKLVQDIPAFVDVVAVFVNPELALVNRVIRELPIQCLQFHGDETAEFCDQFTLPYIKALQATSGQAIRESCTTYKQAAAILLDTPSTVSRGGSGQVFDWQLIPEQCTKPIILAGGLNAGNIVAATERVSPYAVDVCSGVESSPGSKDRYKMNQFVTELWGRNKGEEYE